jgi:alpha-1,3-fucosyltransferase
MTYRLDGDISSVYGNARYKKTLSDRKKKTINQAVGKSKMVARFVSNCDSVSGRENYVDDLRKYVNVDIFGRCGNLESKLGKTRDNDKMVSSTYKFYLSFENGVCKDYVTDNFWNILRSTTTVPIVLGGAPYEKLAPPNSYLDVFNFTTPKNLASHFKMLDKNDAAYNQPHEWRKDYVMDVDHNNSLGCRLCAKLHDRKASTESIRRLEDVWNVATGYRLHAVNIL